MVIICGVIKDINVQPTELIAVCGGKREKPKRTLETAPHDFATLRFSNVYNFIYVSSAVLTETAVHLYVSWTVLTETAIYMSAGQF